MAKSVGKIPQGTKKNPIGKVEGTSKPPKCKPGVMKPCGGKKSCK